MGGVDVEDFEKLGVFYLGKEYDLGQGELREDLLLYDSKDLVTHGVCVGMTGSGKTGLCISLLEEAAIDGIPALVIDPKGDLPNLLLTFPELRPEDFRPWVDDGDAARKNLTPDEFAAKQAATWKDGLAQWGQDGERISRLREAADFTIYTPGSTSGLPISVLKSFAAPGPTVLSDPELLGDRVSTAATSLLTLLGIDADPIQSREHILLSTLFSHAWQRGLDLDIPSLIQQIQKPPVTQIGVLDLESFFPSKDRFGLAMSLNNLLAAPGFQAWLEGDALDIGSLLHTAEGKPRVSIFSIAHLSETERMFFVSLLLNEVLGWARAQPGTGSLRALLYMDEIFGYFPPVAEPPSKKPLLTLLKQARAYGLGVLLATQNPVDLDYKGLANTGTWFIGRLQTERDKARVLEGLEGVAAGSATPFDKQAMEQVLAGLGSRVFLMYNVHEDAPVVFQSRWAMSYLRGPLTRTQIKILMDSKRGVAPTAAPTAAVGEPGAAPAAGLESASGMSAASVASTVASTVAPAARPAAAPAGGGRPLLPPDVPEYFVPARSAGDGLVYRPAAVGAGNVHFVDAALGGDQQRALLVVTPITDAAVPMDWDVGFILDMPVGDLSREPEGEATFSALPAVGGRAASYKEWGKDLASWLYRTQALDLLKSSALKMSSIPGETEGEFRVRLQQAAREQRDLAIERLRESYAPKLLRAEEAIRKAQQAAEREQEQAKGAKLQTAISFGATLLSAFTGRKKLSATTLGRATTAARGVSRSLDQTGDVDRAAETVNAKLQQKKDLDAAFEAEVASLQERLDASALPLTTLSVKPRKSDVDVALVGLAWLPSRPGDGGGLSPAWE
ncbi:MAG: ATP-binding protein [Thermoleophilia bacterium]